MNLLPVFVPDLDAIDRRRIIEALGNLGLGISEISANYLRQRMHPLPSSDRILAIMLSELVAVDWSKNAEKLSPVMEKLREGYETAIASQRHDDVRTWEMKIFAATRGLSEHPAGWDLPCACGTCRSYAGT